MDMEVGQEKPIGISPAMIQMKNCQKRGQRGERDTRDDKNSEPEIDVN